MRRYVLLGLIFLGILISYVDRGNLGIATSSIMRDFHLDGRAMGSLLGAFFWTYAFFQIPAGIALDRFGIRWVYAAAFTLWSLSSAAIAWSRGVNDIWILRLVLGFAETAGPIASMSFIRQNFASNERGLPVSIYVAGQTFGPALGALLGSKLLVQFGWRTMFAVTGLGALVWVPLWLWLAPRGRPIFQESAKPLSGANFWGKMLARPVFWALAGCVFLLSYYWYFVLNWIPGYLTLSGRFTTSEMGTTLSTALFVMAIVNLIFGGVADALVKQKGSVFKIRTTFLVCGLLGAASLFFLITFQDRRLVLPVLMISVCSFGVASSSFWTIAQSVAPAWAVGGTIGLLNTISQFSGIAATNFTGQLLGPKNDFGHAIVVAAASPIIGALLMVVANPGALDRMRVQLAPAEKVTQS